MLLLLMMCLLTWFFLVLTAFPAIAWLPEQMDLFTRDRGFTASPSTKVSLETRLNSTTGKIRGVNLASMFVFEPWLAEDEWRSMGCAGQYSESDCVSYLGQSRANNVFQNHWNTWITQVDLRNMKSYGLNTIRVPVGYWLKEDLVSSNEFFPQGGEGYLDRVCSWASDLGFYIIIDLHGAPGAQVPTNADTGQVRPAQQFYVSSIPYLLECFSNTDATTSMY